MDGQDPTGGSRQLAELIDKYGEFLLPDLKRYYDIDLRDLLSEHPLAPRFVLAHVNNLDYDSAFIAEVRGGQQFRGWDRDRYQLAALTDAVRAQSYLFTLANIDPKKQKPAPPDPTPVPDEISKTKQDKPGSFAFIAKRALAAAKRRKASANGGSR